LTEDHPILEFQPGMSAQIAGGIRFCDADLQGRGDMAPGKQYLGSYGLSQAGGPGNITADCHNHWNDTGYYFLAPLIAVGLQPVMARDQAVYPFERHTPQGQAHRPK
jgi:hypothetical protein